MNAAHQAEEHIAQILTQQGWTILERNYRHIGFELDIIAEKKTTLIVVEVKFRKFAIFLPDMISSRKKNYLQKGTRHYLSHAKGNWETIRFDLAIVEGEDLKVTYVPGFLSE